MIRSATFKPVRMLRRLWASTLTCMMLADGAAQAQVAEPLREFGAPVMGTPVMSTPAVGAPIPAGTTESSETGKGTPASRQETLDQRKEALAALAALKESVEAKEAPAAKAQPIFDPMVMQASCASCRVPGTSACNDYGRCGARCVPGRPPSWWCESDSCIVRFCGGVCDGLCWEDPCYEPRWILEANAAFFQDSPRPVTQTRIRWDRAFNHGFPDTAEFFWAQIGVKGPPNPTAGIRYDDLTLYQEIAAKGASLFFELPYRSLDPSNNPSASGFGDMNVGVKSVLLDRELFLLTLQIKTVIPTGTPNTGLGIGHVALEPSLLSALKLGSKTYLQSQIAEWIPFGGTPGFAGSVFHYHAALNHVLCENGDFLRIVGTAEVNGFSFRGRFTDAAGVVRPNSGLSYVNIGPGIRVMICEKFDFGVGMGFDVSTRHGPEQIYRTELRIRF